MPRRRLAAFAALIVGAGAVLGLVALVVADRGRGLLGPPLFALSVALAWQGVRRRGGARVLGLGGGAVVLAAFAAVIVARHPLILLAVLAALALAAVAGRYAFSARVRRPRAAAPRHPVLFYNPRSGGGKAARYRLADEAAARGMRAVELGPGTDLATLVRAALDAGADALAMAGGDGSQAVVAALASERGVPYACVPAGTRNHFALDLGVDRDDVVGALDAFTEGAERLVDLGEVNGRAFVNNVSLGVYGSAVQRPGYRGAKLRTLLDTVPDVVGPGAPPVLRWRGPDGRRVEGASILVSNNVYRLGLAPGAGTRPRLDEGVLGVAVVSAPPNGPPLTVWTSQTLEIDADGPVPAGIDGEAVTLDPPLRFHLRAAALRCRIARRHPGAAPSAFMPERAWDVVRVLAGIAVGHEPRRLVA
jgi:hypothetical protein